MSEFITRDTDLLISSEPESAYNTNYVDATDFRRMLTTGSPLSLPTLEKLDDSDRIGQGDEFPRQARGNYWSQPKWQISDTVNVDLTALLLARALGGTVTDALVATGVYDHTFSHQVDADGRQLPSSDVVQNVGGQDWLFPGVVVGAFGFSQEGANAPTFTADLVGSGKHVKISSIDPAFGDFPNPIDQNFMHGAATVVSYNDGSLLDFSAAGRLRNVSFQWANNLRENDRRAGDPFLVSGDHFKGAYVNRCLRGRRQLQISLSVTLDENQREYTKNKETTVLTNVKVLCKGAKIDSTRYNEFELIVPKAVIMSIEGGTSDEDLVQNLTLMPLANSSGQILTARIRNSSATLL